jgi:uncharacterized membrane-anchored protein
LKPAVGVAIAIVIQVVIMLLVLLTPLLIRATGTVVYLETEKMDPRALLRGDYVILGYQLAQGILSKTQERNQPPSTPVYVIVTTERPARFVAVSFTQPEPAADQVCIVGRIRGWNGSVDFPQIAQYFIPEGSGQALESARGGNLLAKVAVSADCRAVLLALELR